LQWPGHEQQSQLGEGMPTGHWQLHPHWCQTQPAQLTQQQQQPQMLQSQPQAQPAQQQQMPARSCYNRILEHTLGGPHISNTQPGQQLGQQQQQQQAL